MDRKRASNGTFIQTHGMRRTRLYRIWCAMKERCNNPHNKRYSRYGGRGIKVCDEWSNSYEAFFKWATENGYEDGLTIDRIDCDGPYKPENCRFATTAEQNRNYSRNHMVTYQGKTKCLADWEAETGINRATLLYRLQANKPLNEVFDTTDGRARRWRTISPRSIALT